MMLVMVIVPLLLLLGIVLGLGKRILPRLTAAKWTYSVIGVYILVGVITSFSFSRGEAVERVAPETVKEAHEAEMQLYDIWHTADLTKLDARYLKEQWTFDATGEVVVQYPNPYGERVFVNYVDEGESMTLAYYETPYIAYGLNISRYIKAPTVSFEQNVLSIATNQQEQQLQFYELNPTISFLEQDPFYNNTYGSIGARFLHLNVPRNVHIINESE